MRYIYHHLGLGDHIICNGLVRYVQELCNDNVTLFCKHHNLKSLQYMYRDNEKIILQSFNSDLEVSEYIKSNNLEIYTLRIGFEHEFVSGCAFDETFYKQLNFNFGFRWSKFKMERDIMLELELFDTFNVKDEKYIFLHEDDRFKINRDRIKIDGRRIITVDRALTDNIFLYNTLIERADEVHTIESSFQFIIDSLNLNNNNYVHRYPRKLSPFCIPTYKTVKEIYL